MPQHTEEQHFNYSTIQLFDLVSDVEKYPEFLPWVKAVRVAEHHEHYCIADVIVHFKAITEQYRCRVDVVKPSNTTERGQIDVSLIKGPFHHLVNNWRFEPSETGCEVHFHVDFAFKVKLLDTLIGGLFTRATEKMISAFLKRAEALYG